MLWFWDWNRFWNQIFIVTMIPIPFLIEVKKLRGNQGRYENNFSDLCRHQQQHLEQPYPLTLRTICGLGSNLGGLRGCCLSPAEMEAHGGTRPGMQGMSVCLIGWLHLLMEHEVSLSHSVFI